MFREINVCVQTFIFNEMIRYDVFIAYRIVMLACNVSKKNYLPLVSCFLFFFTSIILNLN